MSESTNDTSDKTSTTSDSSESEESESESSEESSDVTPKAASGDEATVEGDVNAETTIFTESAAATTTAASESTATTGPAPPTTDVTEKAAPSAISEASEESSSTLHSDNELVDAPAAAVPADVVVVHPVAVATSTEDKSEAPPSDEVRGGEKVARVVGQAKSDVIISKPTDDSDVHRVYERTVVQQVRPPKRQQTACATTQLIINYGNVII